MRWFSVILMLVLGAMAACTSISVAPTSTLAARSAQLSNVQSPEALTTESLANYQVVSQDGVTIGPVDGVIIGAQTGDTEYVVVYLADIYNFGKGATNGPQDHYLPIPWSQIRLDIAHQQLVVGMDDAFVKDAPIFLTMPDTSVMGWDQTLVAYWNRDMQ